MILWIVLQSDKFLFVGLLEGATSDLPINISTRNHKLLISYKLDLSRREGNMNLVEDG